MQWREHMRNDATLNKMETESTYTWHRKGKIEIINALDEERRLGNYDTDNIWKA